jgi:hypothetical protein
MGRVKCDHIKRLITLTSDNIKRLSLYNELSFLCSASFNCYLRVIIVTQLDKSLSKQKLFRRTLLLKIRSKLKGKKLDLSKVDVSLETQLLNTRKNISSRLFARNDRQFYIFYSTYKVFSVNSIR